MPDRSPENLSSDRGEIDNSKSKYKPQSGALYEGMVIDYDTAQQDCLVRLDKFGDINAHMTSRAVAGLLGVRDWYKPERGSRCIVLYGDAKHHIICFLDQDIQDETAANTRRVSPEHASDDESWDTWNIQGNPEEGGRGGRGTPYTDMVDGEYDMTNLLGVGVQFMTFLTRLSGGGRASVETHMLRDMVRILSGHFRHIHALGQTEIFEDGGLNIHFDGTPYSYEREGKEDKGEELHKVKGSSDEVQPTSQEERYKDLLRGRISCWVGWLGNMIDLFVTDPGKVLGDMASEGRTGRFRAHVGQDGSALVQSVSEIAFERVSRIPVPLRKKRPGDPEGADVWGEESLEHSWSGPDDDLLASENVFRLREMARILNGHIANFRAEKHPDYEVPSESEIKTPGWRNDSSGEDQGEMVDRYSTIRIMRDGGICILDAYGVSITTHKGHGIISAPKHLRMEAGGDISMIAGQNINLKARRSLNLTAVVGGIKMLSYAFIEGLCQFGSIWFKSDADPENPQEAEKEGPEPVIHEENGVLIEAKNGKASVTSKTGSYVESFGTDAECVLQSRSGDISIKSQNSIKLSSKFILIKALKDVVATGSRFLSNFYSFSVGERFVVRAGGRLDCRFVKSDILTGITGFFGPELGVTGVPSNSQIPVGPHFNHILTRPEDSEMEYFGSFDHETSPSFESESGVEIPGTQAADVLREQAFDLDPIFEASPEFTLQEASEYNWGGDFYESLTQQTMRLESSKFEEWEDWNFSSDTIKSNPDNNSTELPYPGLGTQMNTYDGGESLWREGSKKTDTSLSDFSSSPIRFKFWSREDADDDKPDLDE